MIADNASIKPGRCCHNCGLECNGMFCCAWCVNAYLARLDAHRTAHRQGGQAKPGEGPKAGSLRTTPIESDSATSPTDIASTGT